MASSMSYTYSLFELWKKREEKRERYHNNYDDFVSSFMNILDLHAPLK